ncbi:Nramp family divalent metal transporter [Echinicola shivajiensis]|uniref:Nramp family divalent metal transporter n=1 Tax=Echinicola shivajiensis TaxID=1035916 RepID=UPI001BFC90BF|nr:Nramp family divalent metal transporter [Echinicola shivajiensis]
MVGKKNINWLSVLGPGVITAALVFGPSKMTITSKMGADFSYSLIWTIIVAIFFMMVFTNMSARIGQHNKESLLSLIRIKTGKLGSLFIGGGIFLVATSFQAGNSTGLGIAIGEATSTDAKIWIVLFNILGILLLFFRSFYKMMEKVMLALVILMLLCFTVTAIVVQPSLPNVFSGIKPSIPDESEGLIIAFIASCFSLVGAFYQSYLIQEKRKNQSGLELDAKYAQLSSTVGIVILGLMSAVVLICAATVLHPQGIKVNSASEMGLALAPLFGPLASELFFIGLFGASFSSLVGNATLGGSMLGDALGFKNGLDNNNVKICIAAVMVFGAAIAIAFGKLPLELIVLAQSVTIFLVPFIGISIYWVGNSEEIMGAKKNNAFQRVAGLIGIVLVLFLAIKNFNVLFL